MASRAEKALQAERERLAVKLQVAHMRLLNAEDDLARVDASIAALKKPELASQLERNQR